MELSESEQQNVVVVRHRRLEEWLHNHKPVKGILIIDGGVQSQGRVYDQDERFYKDAVTITRVIDAKWKAYWPKSNDPQDVLNDWTGTTCHLLHRGGDLSDFLNGSLECYKDTHVVVFLINPGGEGELGSSTNRPIVAKLKALYDVAASLNVVVICCQAPYVGGALAREIQRATFDDDDDDDEATRKQKPWCVIVDDKDRNNDSCSWAHVGSKEPSGTLMALVVHKHFAKHPTGATLWETLQNFSVPPPVKSTDALKQAKWRPSHFGQLETLKYMKRKQNAPDPPKMTTLHFAVNYTDPSGRNSATAWLRKQQEMRFNDQSEIPFDWVLDNQEAIIDARNQLKEAGIISYGDLTKGGKAPVLLVLNGADVQQLIMFNLPQENIACTLGSGRS